MSWNAWQKDASGRYEYRNDSTGGLETRPIADERKSAHQWILAILLIGFLILATYAWTLSGDGSVLN
jgi:hypothetical protein